MESRIEEGKRAWERGSVKEGQEGEERERIGKGMCGEGRGGRRGKG